MKKKEAKLLPVKERYPKDCVLQYKDGWWITFTSLNGRIIRSRGSFTTKAMAEHDRRTLNSKYQTNG